MLSKELTKLQTFLKVHQKQGEQEYGELKVKVNSWTSTEANCGG